MIKKYQVLTSNKQKTKDFSLFGFGVQNFEIEIPEILSPSVEEVATFKVFDAYKSINKQNIIIEDTSLEVEGSNFLPTEIKHYSESLINNSNFHGSKAFWKVSVALISHDKIYLSTGYLDGYLKYPVGKGYNFNSIFATNDGLHFEDLPEEEKIRRGPRLIAIRQLKEAIEKNRLESLEVISLKNMPQWNGLYQTEEKLEAQLLKPIQYNKKNHVKVF